MGNATGSNDIQSSIIWLDISVNNKQENINAQQMLQTPTSNLKTFTDDKQCENYIRSLSQKHRIVLIAAGQLGQLIVPRIHPLRQITTIFFYCTNRNNEPWTKNYKKIVGVIDDVNELILQVLSTIEKQQQRIRLQEALPITIFNSKISSIEQSSTELNGEFVNSQILVDCVLRKKSTPSDKIEFVTYCKNKYEKDKAQLKHICEFEGNYSADQALRWYTRDCFLYRLLNQTLRTQDIDQLYLFGFFIRDLDEQLKKNQFQFVTHVYRGQPLPKEETKQLVNSVGHLISMNSFLSTTTDRDVAILFAGDTVDKEYQSVLFEIEADPYIHGIKPFANLAPFSHMIDEDEILMMLGSIFRLTRVRYENDLCVIQLVLCSDNDHDIKPLLDQMKRQYHERGPTHTGVYGMILANMGKYDDAEKYIQRHINESSETDQCSEREKINLGISYRHMAIAARCKGDYKGSLELLQKALAIQMELGKHDAHRIAGIYHEMGNIYLKTDQYEQAIEFFNKGLTVAVDKFGENHLMAADFISSIGTTYGHQKQYSMAVHHHLKALSIREKLLPANHDTLAQSHGNLACSYRSLHKLDLALEHYHTALKIYEKCFPAAHPAVALTYNGLGTVYSDKRNYQQALFHFEKAVAILRTILPADHSDIRAIQYNIDGIRNILRK